MMIMGMAMVNQEEKPGVFMKETSSPTTLSAELIHYVDDQDYEEPAALASTACCSCFIWKRNNNESNRYLLPKQEEKKDGCFTFAEKAKKLKEISEILAGPKWKNFIRRFRCHGFISIKKRRIMQQQQCQYDPQSYALNFDDGIDREADVRYPDLLARYVAAPVGMSKD